MNEEEFFSNRELYEMFNQSISELRSELADFKNDLKETRRVVKKYNELRENINYLNERILTIEQRDHGYSEVMQSIKSWGGYIIALLTLLLYFYQVLGGG